jgi:hypothetical protein
MTRTFVEGLVLSDSFPMGNYMEDLRQTRWLKKLCNILGPCGQIANILPKYESQASVCVAPFQEKFSQNAIYEIVHLITFTQVIN